MKRSRAIQQTDNSIFSYYYNTAWKLLAEPRKFFEQLPNHRRLKHALGFLFISSLFFCTARLAIYHYKNPFLMSLILFVNAVGMTFISAAVSYLVIIILWGRCLAYHSLFSIYAFASGIALLIAWLPFSFWITEPWKWWLVGIGLIYCCDFSKKQAVIIIGISIGLLILFFKLIMA